MVAEGKGVVLDRKSRITETIMRTARRARYALPYLHVVANARQPQLPERFDPLRRLMRQRRMSFSETARRLKQAEAIARRPDGVRLPDQPVIGRRPQRDTFSFAKPAF